MAEAFLLDALQVAPSDTLSHPDDLVGSLVHALLERAALPVEAIDDFVLGVDRRSSGAAGRRQGGDPHDPGRAALIAAGLPLSLTGCTVDRGGCAGLQAVAQAAMAVASGHQDVVLAGALSLGDDAPAAAPSPAVAWRCAQVDEDQADALLRERFAISAEEEEDWAVEGLDRARDSAAWHAMDRADRVDALVGDRALRRAPRREGAVLLVLASEAACERHDLQPRARVLGLQATAADPGWRGLACARAAQAVLERCSLRADEIDSFELDERSAAQALASARLLGAPRVATQRHGGALALGHLGAAEGARQLLTLLRVLDTDDARFGLCAARGDDGQALAIVLDRARYR